MLPYVIRVRVIDYIRNFDFGGVKLKCLVRYFMFLVLVIYFYRLLHRRANVCGEGS